MMVHSRPMPRGRSTGIISRSREHVLWVLRHFSKMSGPKGTALSAYLETVLGWDAQEYGAPFCTAPTPPPDMRCGAPTGMGGSQKLALSLQLLLVLLTSCVPHTRCPGPQSQGHCNEGPPEPRAEASPEQEGTGRGTILEIREGLAAIFKPTKRKMNASCDPRMWGGRTYKRPRRHLLTRLPW